MSLEFLKKRAHSYEGGVCIIVRQLTAHSSQPNPASRASLKGSSTCSHSPAQGSYLRSLPVTSPSRLKRSSRLAMRDHCSSSISMFLTATP